SFLRAHPAWPAEADDVCLQSVLRKRSHRQRDPNFPAVVVLVYDAASRQSVKYGAFRSRCRRDLREADRLDPHVSLLEQSKALPPAFKSPWNPLLPPEPRGEDRKIVARAPVLRSFARLNDSVHFEVPKGYSPSPVRTRSLTSPGWRGPCLCGD